MSKLLTRDEFRQAVLSRDNNRCVFCSAPAQDAHHIMERRLWPDGGYYLDNGASVCAAHHLACESTELSPEDVRRAAGITKIVLPPHLYDDQVYDKWGNIILANGQRLKGELFFDESVQKVIKPYLSLFTTLVKYPRTCHLPWSENITDDDRVIEYLDGFINRRVIVTEKMDGENTTMTRTHIHARSVESRHHDSQAWVKQFWSRIAHDIPDGWRVCGENLYAKHSIAYDGLPSYFMGFSIWNDKNECLPWDETLEWFKLLGITPVPVLYDGDYNVPAIRKLWSDSKWAGSEGYVIRVADGFPYAEFRTKVAKFVRHNHVLTVPHWRYGQRMEVNGLVTKT